MHPECVKQNPFFLAVDMIASWLIPHVFLPSNERHLIPYNAPLSLCWIARLSRLRGATKKLFECRSDCSDWNHKKICIKSRSNDEKPHNCRVYFLWERVTWQIWFPRAVWTQLWTLTVWGFYCNGITVKLMKAFGVMWESVPFGEQPFFFFFVLYVQTWLPWCDLKLSM